MNKLREYLFECFKCHCYKNNTMVQDKGTEILIKINGEIFKVLIK